MIRISNLEPYICTETTPLRDVLSRIDRSDYLFQVVVGADHRVCGTITDGDVRRALLGGAKLEQPACECMNRTPRVGRVGDEIGNAAKLLPGHVSFLPLTDATGRLLEVLVIEVHGHQIPAALIMAGGFGRRLGETTATTPKPLVDVGGKPILEHIMTRLEGAGIHRIFIATHHLSEQIEEFTSSRQNSASIEVIREKKPLGTAGALSLLPQPLSNPLLVLNGDVITRVDLSALSLFHGSHGFDATIAASMYQVKVPYGVIDFDEEGLFRGIEEKPQLMRYVSAGIYYLNPEICHLVQPGQAIDMPNLLNLGRSIGLRIGVFPIHEYWIDVGLPRDLEAARRDHDSSGADA